MNPEQVRTNEHATNITLCEFFLGGIFSHINHFAHLLVQFVIEIVVTNRLSRRTGDAVIFRAQLDVEDCHDRTNHTRPPKLKLVKAAVTKPR